MSKRKVPYEIPPKSFKTTDRHQIAVFGSYVEKNNFCKYLSPFTGLIKKSCLNKSKFYSGFAPFKHGKKNKLSEYSSARFRECHFYV